MKKHVIPDNSLKREKMTMATPYGQSNVISKEQESVRKQMVLNAFSNAIGAHFDMNIPKK
ncbi:hypothetical protein [Atlantibacter sp.]|uniref:hypothetical protein n=1 Tax=Atlantibacter sp. TaxID=1903473 RepID=UPI0028ABD6E4|nr:hypothetical protein [Atlantibacter sp.]